MALWVCINIRNYISKDNPSFSRKDQWNFMHIIYYNFTKKATQPYSMYSGIETGVDGMCIFIVWSDSSPLTALTVCFSLLTQRQPP